MSDEQVQTLHQTVEQAHCAQLHSCTGSVHSCWRTTLSFWSSLTSPGYKRKPPHCLWRDDPRSHWCNGGSCLSFGHTCNLRCRCSLNIPVCMFCHSKGRSSRAHVDPTEQHLVVSAVLYSSLGHNNHSCLCSPTGCGGGSHTHAGTGVFGIPDGRSCEGTAGCCENTALVWQKWRREPCSAHQEAPGACPCLRCSAEGSSGLGPAESACSNPLSLWFCESRGQGLAEGDLWDPC